MQKSNGCSRHDKEELVRLLLEKQRRQKDELLRYYNTGDKVHRKQLDFHQDLHRNRWLFGGNRTGKTVGGAVEAVWRARGNHPYRQITRPQDGWVVSLDYNVQRDVAQKEILRWLNPAWIKDIFVRSGRKDDPANAIIDFIVVESEQGGDSTIGFKSCDQGRSKFQGTAKHWIWFDEEPPEEIYDECKMRTIDTRGDMWGTMTPLQGLTWVYDLIYLNERHDKQVKSWLMEWGDNPYLSPDEIAELESTMTEDEREARQFGKFVAMSGLVYKEFVEEIHVIDPIDIPHEWYDTISIDPAIDVPLSAHFYAQDYDGNIYVMAEHYQAGMDIEHHAGELFRIAGELGWPEYDGYLYSLIDSAANAKTLAAEKSVVDLFYDYKIITNTEIDKDVWSGIQRVKQYLKLRPSEQPAVWPRGKPKLFIFRTCPMLIKEIKSYRWKPEADGPIKRNDHAMDELRYYLKSKPELNSDAEAFLPGTTGGHGKPDFDDDDDEDDEPAKVRFWNL
jgi:phage terminase large subunit-like protein